MMRAVLLCLLVLLAGCGAEEERAAPAQAPSAQLVVRVDPDGTGSAPAKELTLSCASPGESAACRSADGLKAADLEPVSPKRVCTDIFGGPETATISGRLEGKPVSARFSRRNGCEVARWERVAALLEQAK
jgi:hypothetical protein